MNERERRQYEQGKMEINVGRAVYGLYILLAVASTTAIAVSLPFTILDILPKWADIAMASFGAFNAPGSIQAIPKMRTWLKDADGVIKNFEASYINIPVDSQT